PPDDARACKQRRAFLVYAMADNHQDALGRPLIRTACMTALPDRRHRSRWRSTPCADASPRSPESAANTSTHTYDANVGSVIALPATRKVKKPDRAPKSHRTRTAGEYCGINMVGPLC
ncbi:hypothetical protein, partial [Antarctobacter heliothermus]|uniref:hypothetical protein n=1 Tax=Antarctobacter heliothermus TaxID=74033 RepID=UPI001BAF3A49